MLKLIRKAIKEDILRLNELGSKLHQHFERDFHLETEVDNPLAVILVSEANNKINGYLYALNLEDNADLISIYVDGNTRFQHIGTDLLEKLQEICLKKTITLEVRTDNIGALSLYQKCGFTIISVRKKYYHDCDGYLMKWGN